MEQVKIEQEKGEFPKMGKNEAAKEIVSARQRIAAMGANDYEFSAILTQLRGGVLKPEEAVRQVFEIENSKQSYH